MTARYCPLTPTLSPGGGRGGSSKAAPLPRPTYLELRSILKPDVRRRQAEFGAAEYRGGALHIVRGMRLHRVHVAPGALDRIAEKDAAAAARHHQPIDRAHAPIRRLAAIPAAARAKAQRDLGAGAGEAHHLGEIAEHAVLRGVDLGGGLGEPQLRERVLGDARPVADIKAPLLLLAECRESALRDPDRRGAERIGEHQAEGQPV